MTRRILPLITLLAAVLALSSIFAADATCPKGCIDATPPTCAQRVARAKAAGCTLPCAAVPCAAVSVATPGSQGAKGDKGDKGDRGDKGETIAYVAPLASPPKQHWRFGLGPDLGWNEEHRGLVGLHAAFLTPGSNWAMTIGPTYQSHPGATCRIGCRTCGIEPAGPWGALAGFSYFFGRK